MFKTVSQTIDNWVDTSIRDLSNTYLTGIEDFDKSFGYNLRGKSIALIGTAGSCKSMFGLQVATGNSIGTDTQGVYCNGEMSEGNLLERLFDYQYDPTDGDRASVHFKKKLKGLKTKDDVKKFKDILKTQADKYYKNNLLITDCVDLEKIDKALAEHKRKGNNIVGLVIDSAAMVEGEGTAKEIVEYLTKKAKKLANVYNICVLTIFHVPKTIADDKRDLKSEGMDSVRILTNCDATISFSHILDENGKRIPDMKYLQLFNKRGDGGYIDKVCGVDQNRLVLKELDLDPNVFPERNETENRL